MAKEVIAQAKHVRITPLKADRIMMLIRGKDVNEAQTILKFQPHAAARLIEKVLKSVIANAENNDKMKRDNLVIVKAVADNATLWKRFRAGGKGRAARIKKYNSHLTIIVTEKSTAKGAK